MLITHINRLQDGSKALHNAAANDNPVVCKIRIVQGNAHLDCQNIIRTSN